MSRYGKIFHPQHCLMLQIKARLTKAYGTEEGFRRHQMDHQDIQRKLEVRVVLKAKLAGYPPSNLVSVIKAYQPNRFASLAYFSLNSGFRVVDSSHKILCHYHRGN